ncbi:MAG: hypothetical protein K0Q78_943 [Cellvibrio sp.]|nr:hypothetical protein [Cellvibrio sp.]
MINWLKKYCRRSECFPVLDRVLGKFLKLYAQISNNKKPGKPGLSDKRLSSATTPDLLQQTAQHPGSFFMQLNSLG